MLDSNYIVTYIVWTISFWNVSCALEFRYHKNEELEEVLRNLSAKADPEIRTQLYSIGNSSDPDKPQPLWVLELTAAEENKIGVPNVKLLGNMHGNEAGGREVLLHFIEVIGIHINQQ
ncbi:hypothetical protein JTB14_014234 [Gonioctena quinquepunctata]|nr:hypothetical protein JTB14_014234 [Gonioctena quinquepunctata]